MENGSVFLNHEISTSIAGLLRGMELQEALDTVHAAGFRHLDFPISVFSRPEGSPLKTDGWRDWVNALKQKLDDMGFTVTQAHASWEQAIPEDFSPHEPYPVYYRTIEACRMLGCGKLVFHAPLYFFPTHDRATQSRIGQWNVRWFRRLIPTLREFSVTGELENTFDYGRVWQPGDPPFTYCSSQDMLELLEDIDSDCFALCLDTGHGNIAGFDPGEMIRDYGKHLQVLHLNDNFGFIRPVYEDLHLLPGGGNLDWPSIFSSLREMDYRGNFNLEPVGALPKLPFSVRVVQLKAAKETVRLLARDTGFPL